MTEQDTLRILREWSDRLVAELGLADAPVDVDAILSLAGVAAHSVIRPAAPVTTYIVGFAAGLAAANTRPGAGSVPAESVAETASATAKTLAREYAAEVGGEDPPTIAHQR